MYTCIACLTLPPAVAPTSADQQQPLKARKALLTLNNEQAFSQKLEKGISLIILKKI